MEIDCNNLREFVQSFSLVNSCDRINNGALRISTPFRYPNGSQIDLFLQVTGDMFNDYILSDYGMTANYLLDMQIKPWAAKKRRLLIDDICSVLGVAYSAGKLQIHIDQRDLAALPQAMVRVAQACIRVADLSFTQRLQIIGTFQEEVEEFIAENNLSYEPDVTLIGEYDREIKIDFRVQGKAVTSLIQTLSTPSVTNAHNRSLEVFSRWYDLLRIYRPTNQFITLFDTTNNIFRRDDLGRLGDVSLLLGYPEEQKTLQEVLTA
jgi:hypothetical protein